MWRTFLRRGEVTIFDHARFQPAPNHPPGGKRPELGEHEIMVDVVEGLRHHWHIPCHQPSNDPPDGDLLTVADAAAELRLAPSTLHRWLGDGFIAGEQLTPGAPWRIRLTNDIRALFVDDAPDGWLAMLEATLAYGVTRQTLLHRVKRGELRAVHVRTGRRKGLRIPPPPTPDSLF